MHTSVLFVFVCVFFLKCVMIAHCIQEIKEEKDVLVLSQDNFDSVIIDKDIILVEFYAPWCGHCQSLEPLFAEAAKILKISGINLGKVDATVHSKLAEKYGVQGYPTLKFFKKMYLGEVFDYRAARTTEGIVEFMKEVAKADWKPPLVLKGLLQLSSTNFTEFITKQSFWLVAFIQPGDKISDKLKEECTALADDLKMQDPPSAVGYIDMSADSELAKKYTDKPTVIGFKGISDQPLKYFHEVTLENLKKFAKAHTRGNVRDIDDINHVVAAQGGLVNVFVGVFNDRNSEKAGFFSQFIIEHGIFYQKTLEGGFVSPKIAKTLKLEDNSIYMQRAPKLLLPKEQGLFKYSGPATFKDLRNWIHSNVLPTVGSNDFANKEYYQEALPVCFLFLTVDFFGEMASSTRMWHGRLAEIATMPKYSSIKFALSDDQDEEQVKNFRLEDNSGDFGMGCYDKDGVKYALSDVDGFDKEAIVEFLDKFLAGKLKPVLRSAIKPAKNDGLVKILTGESFTSLVHQDKTHNSLVLLCATENMECKIALNDFEAFAKTENVATYKLAPLFLNTALNDAPGKYRYDKNFKDHPAVMLGLVDKKQAPVYFSEPYVTKESLLEFVQKHIKAGKEEL